MNTTARIAAQRRTSSSSRRGAAARSRATGASVIVATEPQVLELLRDTRVPWGKTAVRLLLRRTPLRLGELCGLKQCRDRQCLGRAALAFAHARLQLAVRRHQHDGSGP